MKIVKLDQLQIELYNEAGGKARGLAELKRAGLETADGFVIMGLSGEDDYNTAADYYEKCGFTKAAVRSSAAAEDGADFSNAGQYRSFLNIEGRKAFIEALRGCVSSLDNAEAAAYSGYFSQAKSASMSVVVQAMVDAQCAGVCFTVNPGTGNGMLIEAVPGLGESLVSGTEEAEQIIIHPDGIILIIPGRVLNAENANAVFNGAEKARDHFKTELDLEWAIDREGKLHWLQARPITTLDEVFIDEFDNKGDDSKKTFTNCNVGEMLPGAVTPLSLSTSVYILEAGLRIMLVKAGAYKNLKEIPPKHVTCSFSNHLFFNLTSIYRMASQMVGASKEAVESSICGKTLKDTPPSPWKNASTLVRIINGIKYGSFLFKRNKAQKWADAFSEKMHILHSPDMGTFYRNIDAALDSCQKISYFHYISSAHSGAMSSGIIQMLIKEGYSEDDARSKLADFLQDIDNIDSVDILHSMRRIAREALNRNPDSVHFTTEKLAAFITEDKGALGKAYESFIKRHGHRAIREAEMRNRSWEDDENRLMENIKVVMISGALEIPKGVSRAEAIIEAFLSETKGNPKAFSWLIREARQGVVNREYTKSKLILAIDKLKKAYRKLSEMLAAANMLPDPDLIYFLTHEEIGVLVSEHRASLVKKAVQRRRLLDKQMELTFPELSIGKPLPLKHEEKNAAENITLLGTAISRGETEGIARVVRNTKDALQLQKGEIMISAFTDIGWSPYFSIIGGLVTEVGSALSHGSVVAREYSLPLVANVANATRIIKTGSRISIDGASGTVKILELPEACETEAV